MILIFRIRYRIVDDIQELRNISKEEFEEEWVDIEGFFCLQINNNMLGYYHEQRLQKYEIGLNLLTINFDNLLEVRKELSYKQYVAMRIIESNDRWLEFKKEGNNLFISIIEYSGHSNSGYLLFDAIKGGSYLDWKQEQILFNEFDKEVVKITKQYISELEEINPVLLDTKLIMKLKSKL